MSLTHIARPDLPPFKRYLLPYKGPTYLQQQSDLPASNVLLTPIQRPDLPPFNALLTLIQRPDWPPFNTLLTPVQQSDLLPFNALLTLVQRPDLPRFSLVLTPIQSWTYHHSVRYLPPYKGPTYLCSMHYWLAYKGHSVRYLLPYNSQTYLRSMRYLLLYNGRTYSLQHFTYSHTTVRLTRDLPPFNVLLTPIQWSDLLAYKGRAYPPSTSYLLL